MKEKSLAQLDAQWKRIIDYARAKGKEYFWHCLGIRCRYSVNMQKAMSEPVFYYGRVYNQELYNKPVPKAVYCGE